MTSFSEKDRFNHSSPNRSRAMLAISLFAIGIFSCSVATAWTVVVACPDEFPGPPDCFDCNAFGDTAAIDPDAFYSWDARDFWGRYGSFDGPSGIDARNNHFNCEMQVSDVTAQVLLDVAINVSPYYKGAVTYVTCSGVGV